MNDEFFQINDGSGPKRREIKAYLEGDRGICVESGPGYEKTTEGAIQQLSL